MTSTSISDAEYRMLAMFRRELRLFMQFSEDVAVKAGLTAQHYQALLTIRAAPEAQMLVGELAEQLLIRPNSATELVDRLEALQLVERNAAQNDRRQVRVVLTESANKLLQSLAAMHRDELQRLGPLLTDLLTRLSPDAC
ncbi:MAG: MarR family transcriptional regulator [Pseudomonadota bacterium]|nr:MarR family transcriptional regulator [Pseudomonadota bacterium]